MKIKEKFLLLLNTRRKRIAAAAAFVFVLFVAVLILYIIPKSEKKTKKANKDATKEQETEMVPTSTSQNGVSRFRGNRTNGLRPLGSKQNRQAACGEALACLDRIVKAKADQATLEGLLEQVEKLCPEDEFHASRASIRNSNISTQEGVRAALNDALERPTLGTAELDSLFQRLKELTPTEASPSLSDYAANLYEALKDKEANATVKKDAKKLRRLLRTVKSLKPDYVDDPPLEEIVDSAGDNDVEPTADTIASAGKGADFEPSADTVADTEAQEIITSDSHNLVDTQPDRRSSLTQEMKKALDRRNEYLKKLCELGDSLPSEFRAEFNNWKLAGFKTTRSPEFVAFMEKARNSNEEILLDTLFASLVYQRAQASFISESHKHRVDRDDGKYYNENQSELARFIVDLKEAGIPISNTMLEWLKGDNWEQIKRYVEQELSCHPSMDYIPVWYYEAAGTEYYRATGVFLQIHRIRKSLSRCKIVHSPNLQDYWTAVEKAWRGGSREYEKLKYQEYKKLREFEELENKFKGTNVHTYRDEFVNIYEAVHMKLEALEFLNKYQSTELEQVKRKAIALGIDPENIKDSHLSLFEGCPKVYNLLIIKLFSSKVKEASLTQIATLMNEHYAEFKRITLELASFKKCDELATKIREGICSISTEGKISCSAPRWNERASDPKWLGYVLFKPTKPYQSSYLRDLLSREQELRQRYDHLKLIHMFINDIKIDSSVHPGRPTKKMHLSTNVFDFDSPSFKDTHHGGATTFK